MGRVLGDALGCVLMGGVLEKGLHLREGMLERVPFSPPQLFGAFGFFGIFEQRPDGVRVIGMARCPQPQKANRLGGSVSRGAECGISCDFELFVQACVHLRQSHGGIPPLLDAIQYSTLSSRASSRILVRMKKMRLDDLLVEQGYFPDRATALRAVIAREVRVDDVYATSAAVKVPLDADVFVRGQKRYVSRGGHKLQGALDAFSQKAAGLRCIDVGSSTGGFTDCLLQAGAAQVTCVDVNYGQLAWKVRQDPRVAVFERTNIKFADPELLGAPFDLIVADVSFIGLASLAPAFARLSDSGSVFIGLVKPQFESRHDETERGVVRDEAVRLRTVDEVKCALAAVGFEVTGVVESPIVGPEGNVEYLVRAVFQG